VKAQIELEILHARVQLDLFHTYLETLRGMQKSRSIWICHQNQMLQVFDFIRKEKNHIFFFRCFAEPRMACAKLSPSNIQLIEGFLMRTFSYHKDKTDGQD